MAAGNKSLLVSSTIDVYIAENAALHHNKAVVFSQFTGFLALIASALKARNVPFRMLTGSMTLAARSAAARPFMGSAAVAGSSEGDGAGPVVLLASLRAAGQGLNLVGANHVYLMDPW